MNEESQTQQSNHLINNNVQKYMAMVAYRSFTFSFIGMTCTVLSITMAFWDC